MRLPVSAISLIPPGTGGVYDYALELNQTLDTHIIPFEPETPTQSLSGDLLVLHYSGYGFHPRGVPDWLVDRLRGLRPRFTVIAVVFHELFAGGPPWRSAFWLRGRQKRIVRELAALSDFWLTNRDGSAEWLQQRTAPRPHRVLPVSSNVGEPSQRAAVRERSLVVFGSSGVRATAYRADGGAIFRVARERGLKLHDIGPPTSDPALADRLKQEDVVVHGRLPGPDVSQALSRAMYGALVYPASFVAKSGIFAAYCAHGLCPVLVTREHAMHDGLMPNRQYAAGFDAIDSPSADATTIGQAAFDWYAPHSVRRQADAFVELLAGVSSPVGNESASHAS